MDLNEKFALDVLEVAKEAGELIVDLRGQKGFKVERKPDGSRVTNVDIASSEFLKPRLRKILNVPVMSEEDKPEEYAIRSKWVRYWVIDPVDGTDELVNLDGTFCVNIALIENCVPVFGMIYYPITSNAHYGWKDGGAYFWEKDNIKKIRVAEREETLKIVYSQKRYNDATKVFVEGFEDYEVILAKGTCKFGMIASGEAHIHPKFAPSFEWDTAPAQIIIEEAGGSFVSATSGKPLSYNKRDLANPHFIASY